MVKELLNKYYIKEAQKWTNKYYALEAKIIIFDSVTYGAKCVISDVSEEDFLNNRGKLHDVLINRLIKYARLANGYREKIGLDRVRNEYGFYWIDSINGKDIYGRPTTIS